MTENKQPLLEEEEDVSPIELSVDDSFLGDEEEEQGPSPWLVNIILGGVLVCVLGGLLGGYWLYPFGHKLKGSWATEEGVAYQLTSDGKTFSVQTTTDTPGVSFVYKGVWQGIGPNQYEGQDIKVQVVIDKRVLGQEEIDQFQQQSDVFKLVTTTEKELVVEYSDKSAKTLLNTENLSSFFRYTLTKFHNLGGKEALEWNNASFSEELMYLYPVIEETE